MKIYFFVLCIISTIIGKALAQKYNLTSKEKKVENRIDFPDFNRYLLLEEKTDTTANVSFGDFDGDGHLDILLVKGRHWPIVDRILLGDGKGNIRKKYNLGTISDRSYTGGVADFNKDGFPDIAVSNDNPDRKLIYFNDGKGRFEIGAAFGLPKWPTRNLSIADINADGLPDIILANRGGPSTSNYICLNKGKGQFDSNCIPFAPYPATTISPVDYNKDGFIDLVVPHRNGGQSYLYTGNSTFAYSESNRIPFGPSDAKIRMSAVADFNADNLLDIIVIDENKGVDLYFGQKDQTFAEAVSLADVKTTPYAMLIADLNNDKKMDIIVGHVQSPSTVFFNDGTGLHFNSISFGDVKGTVYGFAVADLNEDGIMDIACAKSDATNILYFGNSKTKNRK